MKKLFLMKFFLFSNFLVFFLLTDFSFSQIKNTNISDIGKKEEIRRFIFTNNNGSYLTDNSGKTWTKLVNELPLKVFIFTKSDGATLKTEDAGKTWSLCYDEIPEIQLNVFPNPAVNLINIVTSDDTKKINKITILDLTGNTLNVYNKVHSSNYSINIDKLNSGIYFLKIEMSNGSFSIAKFIKQ